MWTVKVLKEGDATSSSLYVFISWTWNWYKILGSKKIFSTNRIAQIWSFFDLGILGEHTKSQTKAPIQQQQLTKVHREETSSRGRMEKERMDVRFHGWMRRFRVWGSTMWRQAEGEVCSLSLLPERLQRCCETLSPIAPIAGSDGEARESQP